jgi:ABC-type uncharacterized transport system substrate-binding protein
MWASVLDRVKEKASQLNGITIYDMQTIHTYSEFKQKVMAYQKTADALGLLGIFHFTNENGENVPYQEVLQWVANNSKLPDFAYWKDRIKFGTLCAVTVSGYEQGLAAGKMAKRILADGQTPPTFPMVPTTKGEPIVSLARARKLGLKIKSDILLTAEVVTEFQWDK